MSEGVDRKVRSFFALDRLVAAGAGEVLPRESHGAALFADISGFTPLTNRLRDAQGADRGGESLGAALTAMFDVLVGAVRAADGVVVSFAGDAITCWFADDGGSRAVAAASHIQHGFPEVARVDIGPDESAEVSVKVAVAVGAAERLAVGDRSHHLVDVLVGPTVDRMAAAEQLAEPGDIVVDSSAAASLPSGVLVAEWREADGERFAVVAGVAEPVDVDTDVASPIDVAALADELHPEVRDRVEFQPEAFTAEFRTVSIVFVRCLDLSFETSEGLDRLDSYVRWVQGEAADLSGVLTAIVTGDKGAYLQIVFGALRRSEDDLARGLRLATTIAAESPATGVGDVSIGVTAGVNLVGPYGATTRRAFGLLGHSVNKAARLMTLASAGEVLVDEVIEGVDGFDVASHGAHELKGLDSPVEVFRVLAASEASSATTSAAPAGSEIERPAAWAVAAAAIDDVGPDHPTVVVVVQGGAGIGKSHFVEQIARNARTRGWVAVGASASAIDRGTAYHPLRHALGELVPHDERERLEALAPDLADRFALLNAVVGTSYPETEITAPMVGPVRADNTVALLVELIDRARGNRPLLLTLDDVQFLDSASWRLVRELETRHDAMVVLSGRSREAAEQSRDWYEVSERTDVRHIEIGPMTDAEVVTLAATRLGVTELPPEVAATIADKTQGNPFFVEEIAYALRDAGHIVVDGGMCRLGEGGWPDDLSLPDTIEGVVLGRLDELPEAQRLLVRVASTVGRVFAVALLRDVHPIAEEQPHVERHLVDLEQHHISLPEDGDPVVNHLFRHVITRDVAYESLTYAQRRTLHLRIAEWYENQLRSEGDATAGVLAHHWARAGIRGQAVDWAVRAAEEALENNANREALQFIEDADRIGADDDTNRWDEAPIEPGPTDQARRRFIAGEALYRMGELNESEGHFARALDGLGVGPPQRDLGLVAAALGNVGRQLVGGVKQAKAVSPAGRDRQELEVTIHERMIETAFMRGDNLRTAYSTLQSVTGAERLGPSAALADAYSKMCIASGIAGLHPAARMYERRANELLAHATEPIGRADILMSLSVYRASLGDRDSTMALLDEAATILDRYGHRARQRIALELLRLQARFVGDLDEHESLSHTIFDSADRDDDALYRVIAVNGLMATAIERGHGQLALEFRSRVDQESTEITDVERAKLVLHAAFAGEDDADGDATADEAVRLLGALPPTSFGWLMAYADGALLALDRWGGGDERSVAVLKRLRAYARVFPIGRPRRLVIDGRRAVAKGRRGKGERMLREAVRLADGFTMPIEQGIAAAALAGVLEPGYEREALLDRARESFTTAGAARRLARLEERLG